MMELKPCPLCGGTAEVQKCHVWHVWMDAKSHQKCKYVKCNICGLETRSYPTEEEAAQAWNRRTKEVPNG